ncbi:MAG: hypothetical protein R6X32_06115 [Chloroflexota bacterium]
MATLATREQILGIEDAEYRDVEVPQWNGLVVRLKALTALERDRFDGTMTTGRGKNVKVNWEHARARLIVATAVDEKGEPLFTHKDIEALSQKNAAAVDVLFAAAQELCGITNRDIEDLAGNLKSSRSEE